MDAPVKREKLYNMIISEKTVSVYGLRGKI